MSQVSLKQLFRDSGLVRPEGYLTSPKPLRCVVRRQPLRAYAHIVNKARMERLSQISLQITKGVIHQGLEDRWALLGSEIQDLGPE